MINHKFVLKNAFQEVLNRIDNLINEGCGWIVELIDFQYINISGSYYVQLPVELRIPKKWTN